MRESRVGVLQSFRSRDPLVGVYSSVLSSFQNGVLLRVICFNCCTNFIPLITMNNMEVDEKSTVQTSDDGVNSSDRASVRFTDYYQMTIKPLLEEGKDGELIDWLKDIGLLRRSQKCTNPDCQGTKPMEWKRARIVDKFHWSCPLCKKKVSIRIDSPLLEFHCSFKIILETIIAWCDGISLEEYTKENKNVKGVIPKRIYSACTAATDWYMQSHPELTFLGGENSVVLVDTFPDGCMTTTPHNNNYSKRVLCVADTSHMPARIWAQLIDNKVLDYQKLAAIVVGHIRPGSTIVASPALFPLLHGVKGMAEVISVEALMALDPLDYQRSLKNLETIWRTTVSVCQEIQNTNNAEGEQLLRELAWRQVFPSPLSQILHDLASRPA